MRIESTMDRQDAQNHLTRSQEPPTNLTQRVSRVSCCKFPSLRPRRSYRCDRRSSLSGVVGSRPLYFPALGITLDPFEGRVLRLIHVWGRYGSQRQGEEVFRVFVAGGHE